jgi:DNA-binding NarL/FixJ family response regulator
VVVNLRHMAANSTLLCIHRDPGQLSLLKKNGYELLTATNARDGLRLFMLQTVDAIVVEYHLGLLDGAVVAAEIKQVQPRVPIVMLADHSELPEGALKSVDVLVAKSDGPRLLSEAVRLALSLKPQGRDRKVNDRSRQKAGLGESRLPRGARSETPRPMQDDQKDPFSPELWEGILDGTFQF